MSEDAAPNAGLDQGMKMKNLNLLLLRVKEKLAALQIEHDAKSKKLSDLESAHAKLQTQHINLQSKYKKTEEELTNKFNAAVATGKSEAETLNAKMAKLKSDMQRSSSVMQSELQEEICSLQSSLQSTQSALSTSQQMLEHERTRLGGQLQTTQHELKEARLESEQQITELRKEREEKMKTQYNLSDKTKECDANLSKCKKLDEQCIALSDQLGVSKQQISKWEQVSENWRMKYQHSTRLKSEMKKNLKHYQLLLKYSAIASYTERYKMKKLMMHVYEKVGQLCAEAITQPDIPPGVTPGTKAAFSAANSPKPTQQSEIKDGKRSSRRSSLNAGETVSASAAAAPPTTTTPASTNSSTSQPPTTTATSASSTSSTTAASSTDPSSSQPLSSDPHSSGSTGLLRATVLSGNTPGSKFNALTGNMGALPRYSVGSQALTDREWEIHVADLARRSDLQGKTTNFRLLQLIEDKLAILSPVVGELRMEVLSSRSTSEGMFQRTLQLSRKNMAVLSKYEREKHRTESLKNKLGQLLLENKRLKRIEYMYCRLTDKDKGAIGGNAAINQPLTLKEVLALEREQVDPTSSTARKSRLKGTTGYGPTSVDTSGLEHAGAGGGGHHHSSAEPREEKELQAQMLAMEDDDPYLDSSTDDDDEDHHHHHHNYPLSPRDGRKSSTSTKGPSVNTIISSTKENRKSKVKETILPSNSPQVAGPSSTVKSPSSRNSGGSVRFPPASRGGSNSNRTSLNNQGSGSTLTSPRSAGGNMWMGTPSPPSTAPSGSQSSRARSGWKATASSSKGGDSTNVDDKQSEEVDYGANDDGSNAGGAAGADGADTGGITSGVSGMSLLESRGAISQQPATRRSRNPYSVPSNTRHVHEVARANKEKRSSLNNASPNRPGTSGTTQHVLHIGSRPNTGAAPKIHLLNNPVQSSTSAILAAAGAPAPADNE